MNRMVKTILGAGIAAILLMGLAIATLHVHTPAWEAYRTVVFWMIRIAGGAALVVGLPFAVCTSNLTFQQCWSTLWLTGKIDWTRK
ncbi:hypothetical protein GSbR_05090 [Geobacter sp. SVR]|nr:hypothetical protein GSVR_09610 [Geobacter sp. SVR]GCF83909.1 hypothetical protein GSbR_05090 [Geobacter sp. SVR]